MFVNKPVIYSMMLLGLHSYCNEKLLHLQYQSSVMKIAATFIIHASIIKDLSHAFFTFKARS